MTPDNPIHNPSRKRRIKLTIEYDGTHFRGWQIQNTTDERTVQAELEKVLQELFPESSNNLHGAGRTDAGVHAVGMIAHYNTDDDIPLHKIPLAFNSLLPLDICVLKAEEVGQDFEAQFSCIYRRYFYRMKFSREGLEGRALDRNRVLYLKQKLDVEAMIEAAPLFEGERDYAALAKRETRSTIRKVHLCRLEPTYLSQPTQALSPVSYSLNNATLNNPNAALTLHVAANGFLRGMVRAIVGTLIYIGQGKIAASDIDTLLATKDRSKMGASAPAHGLYFAEAGYTSWEDRQAISELEYAKKNKL